MLRLLTRSTECLSSQRGWLCSVACRLGDNISDPLHLIQEDVQPRQQVHAFHVDLVCEGHKHKVCQGPNPVFPTDVDAQIHSGLEFFAAHIEPVTVVHIEMGDMLHNDTHNLVSWWRRPMLEERLRSFVAEGLYEMRKLRLVLRLQMPGFLQSNVPAAGTITR